MAPCPVRRELPAPILLLVLCACALLPVSQGAAPWWQTSAGSYDDGQGNDSAGHRFPKRLTYPVKEIRPSSGRGGMRNPHPAGSLQSRMHNIVEEVPDRIRARREFRAMRYRKANGPRVQFKVMHGPGNWKHSPEENPKHWSETELEMDYQQTRDASG